MARTQSQPEPTVIVQDVDAFTAGGLADDFDGRAFNFRAVPWDYDGTIDHHVLAVAVDYEPDADSGLDPFTQMYSAGDLGAFVPVGEKPDGTKYFIDLDNWSKGDDGGCFIGNAPGTSKTMSTSSNWAQYLQSLKDSGYPDKHVDLRKYDVRGHFNRVPQKDRKGLEKPAGGSGRQPTILVMTELDKKGTATGGTGASGKKTGNGGAKPTSKPADATTPTTAPAATSASDTDLDTTVTTLIIAALNKRGVDTEGVGKVIPVASLSGALVATHGPKTASKDVRERAKDPEFLKQAEGFFYDEDEGYVYLLEE